MTKDRENLEWLVYWALGNNPEPIITIGRGRELLDFEYMQDMKDWYNEKCKEEK
jgi:hypothetical protein